MIFCEFFWNHLFRFNISAGATRYSDKVACLIRSRYGKSTLRNPIGRRTDAFPHSTNQTANFERGLKLRYSRLPVLNRRVNQAEKRVASRLSSPALELLRAYVVLINILAHTRVALTTSALIAGSALPLVTTRTVFLMSFGSIVIRQKIVGQNSGKE